MQTESSKAKRTRQFIIQTMAGIFNQRGYAATSLADLTAATGLSKGSIYGNFADKQAVAVACFEYNVGCLKAVIEPAIAAAGSFEAKLLVYVEAYQSFFAQGYPTGGCPILNTAIDADDTNAELKQRAAQAVLAWKNRLVELIQGGQATGEFGGESQAEPTALAIIALVEGGLMVAKVTDQSVYMHLILATVRQLIDQLKAKH